MLLALVALGVALGYAASLRPPSRGWLRTVPVVNRALALVLVALGLATHTPLLDPLAWSARDQLRRLLEGRVAPADFDFGFLRFQLGRAGERALAELERFAKQEGQDAVRDGAWRARIADSYESWRNEHYALRWEDLFVRPEDPPLPPALLDAIREASTAWDAQRCRARRSCSAVPIELDDRAGSEWIILFDDADFPRALVFAESSGHWSRRGNLVTSGVPGGALDAALRGGRFETVAPLWRDVMIGGRRYRMQDAR
jgi:hypothetical protein